MILSRFLYLPQITTLKLIYVTELTERQTVQILIILLLTHCILIGSSTVICWTSPFVILGMSGLFCLFFFFFLFSIFMPCDDSQRGGGAEGGGIIFCPYNVTLSVCPAIHLSAHHTLKVKVCVINSS